MSDCFFSVFLIFGIGQPVCWSLILNPTRWQFYILFVTDTDSILVIILIGRYSLPLSILQCFACSLSLGLILFALWFIFTVDDKPILITLLFIAKEVHVISMLKNFFSELVCVLMFWSSNSIEKRKLCIFMHCSRFLNPFNWKRFQMVFR